MQKRTFYDFEVGEEFTLDGTTVRTVLGIGCLSCYFEVNDSCLLCYDFAERLTKMSCASVRRDGYRVIFKPIKKKKTKWNFRLDPKTYEIIEVSR